MPKDRPTILQIIPQLDAGGAELSTVEMADAVVRAGGRALVLSEPGRLTPRVAAVGGEPLPFPAATKNPFRLFANAHALKKIMKAEGVDLIHARSRAPAWSALAAARSTGIPFVTTYHGAYNDPNALKRFYNGVMARGDVVIANSRYTAALIAHKHAVPGHRLEVIYRGVDPDVFDPATIEPQRLAALRRQWGVSQHQRIILQAARLTRWKGQRLLIDALARLHKDGRLQDTVAVLAGDPQGRDDYVHELHQHIEHLGLGGKVLLPGHVDDIAAAYLMAHVTVIASVEPEAFGRTAIEAAALGCPVVATDIGAPPETILAQPLVKKEEMTGWLVPAHDAVKLADCLDQAFALSQEERAAMGRHARRHVLANFTTAHMQRRTLAAYDRLLGTQLEARFSAGRWRPEEAARQP